MSVVKPWFDDATVAVARERAAYAMTPPYPPSEALPEWPNVAPGREDNPAYRAVRAALRDLGLDAARFGTPRWDPLGDIVRPGDSVVLKPNLVSHRNFRKDAGSVADTDCLVTHGSFIRAVLDYAAKALQGRGRVLIADCPIQGTSWSHIVSLVGLDAVLGDAARRFPGIELRSRDYRLTRAAMIGSQVVAHRSRPGDEAAFVELDLQRESLLVPLMKPGVAFGVAQYARRRMRRAHTPESNLYIMPREFLDADVFINLPKMKTHQKAGITCALKNLVGVNGHKDYLPHFRYGSPRRGGDEYPDGNALWELYWALVHENWERDSVALKMAARAGALACSQVLRRGLDYPRSTFAQGSGSWHRNDTLWRTILDINRAFLCYDRDRGSLADAPSRRYLSLLDGLVGGESESPLAPSPVAAGFVVAARNPAALDTVAAALMGLDWRKLPHVANAYALQRHRIAAFRPEQIVIRGLPDVETVADVHARRAFVPFQPSVGWKTHIEFDIPEAAASREGAPSRRAG